MIGSSVLEFYKDRIEELKNSRGFSDYGLVLRRGKTQNPYTISDHKNIIVPLDAKTNNGDIIERSNGDKYIILARQVGADCTSMQGKRINCQITMAHIEDRFENHKRVGVVETIYATGVDVYSEDQSASMRVYDSGLLPHTVKKLYIQLGYDIKILDRFIYNGHKYQVDDIERERYRNMIVVQVSEDTRK